MAQSKIAKAISQQFLENAHLFEERNEVYGDGFVHFGPVMAALFPGGMEVVTADDWNRVGLLIQIVSKLTRWAANPGHSDSTRDLAVYATILHTVEAELAAEGVELSSMKITMPPPSEADLPIGECPVCGGMSIAAREIEGAIEYSCLNDHRWRVHPEE